MQAVDLDTITIKPGQEKKAGGPLQFVSAIVLVMMLYMTLILYGVSVMRSVLEEKTSRVMEVVLSSATANQLMAGKILGVGAVGLTQILLWVVIGLGATTPGLLAARNQLADINLAPGAIPAFAVFFVLGFLLQRALCRVRRHGQLRARGAAMAVPGGHADHYSRHADDLPHPPAQRALVHVDVAGAVLPRF